MSSFLSMSTSLFSRQDPTDPLPGALPHNGGTIAVAVSLSLFVVICVPALVIWHRRRKVVKAQMAKTAEGAAAWRAHRAREREFEDHSRRQRFLWHRADRTADLEAAAVQAEQETVPMYEARGTGDGRPPEYDDLELRPLPPAHVQEYYGNGRSSPLPPPPPAIHLQGRSQALQPGTSATTESPETSAPSPALQQPAAKVTAEQTTATTDS